MLVLIYKNNLDHLLIIFLRYYYFILPIAVHLLVRDRPTFKIYYFTAI